MVKISAIVPVYNVENYLAQCLDSILRQTLKDIEILCIDDGSDDDSQEILKAYADFDKRIKVIHQKNKGVSAARNRGLKEASGEYISFIDADDWISPLMFERLYKNAKKHSSDFVFCNINSFETQSFQPYMPDKGLSERYRKLFKNKSFCEKDLDEKEYFNQHVTVWNKLYKRSFLKKNNLKFYEGLIFEDYLFFTQIFFKAQRISFDGKALYFYRLNREGSIRKAADKRYFDIFKIAEEVTKTVKASGEWEKYKMPLLLKNVKDLLYYYSAVSPQYREEFFNEIKKQYWGKSFADYDFEVLLQNAPFTLLMALLEKDYQEFKNIEIDLRVLDE